MISCILVRGFVTPNQNVKLNAPFYPILVPCPSIHPISPISLPSRLRYFHASNEHHKWLKKRDWPAVQNVMCHLDRNDNFAQEKVQGEMSMDDCHIIGSQRKLRHTLMLLPMWACSRFG